MARLRLEAVDRPEVRALEISPRLRSQLAYFATPGGTDGAPVLGEGEYWIAAAESSRALDEGVVYLVSPLDTANMTEVEITEEQEVLLDWLVRGGVERVRVVEG